jgi:cysteinyl-tRNA synthetase
MSRREECSVADDGLRFWNTLTREKQKFLPIEAGKVRLYVCGPTVYNDPHIGNWRTFLFGDILRRWLEYRGYTVFHVMNITDIDDKTIRNSGKEGVSLAAFTDRYTQSFFHGLNKLNILQATVYPRATDYIPEMVQFIHKLLQKGVAYEARDGVYFDIDAFPTYGQLSRIALNKVKSTTRMDADEYDKDAAQDFALWKRSTPEELQRGICFDSPWGKGRPGWHIECSVMTNTLLGETLDFHVGGEDLVFPHHENEIAQSESVTGQPFVRYWLHVRHLMIDGRKMSKSLGNYVSFEDVLTQYGVETLRYFFLSVHYRRPIDFTHATIEIARNSMARLQTTIDLIEDALQNDEEGLGVPAETFTFLEAIHQYRLAFESAMDDDLDTHRALDALHAISKTINEYCSTMPNKAALITARRVYWQLLDSIGLYSLDKQSSQVEIHDHSHALINLLLALRNRLRAEQHYALSDSIRDELNQLGILVTDTANGTTWKRETRN